MLVIWVDRGIVIKLEEKWHFETNSIHLPMGEAIVTLEVVWRILRIPIHDELAMYESAIEREALNCMFEVDPNELCIIYYEIIWEIMVAQHLRLVTIIIVVITGLIALNNTFGHIFQ